MKFFAGGFHGERSDSEAVSFVWEGVEDPRNGNAALHEFHELRVMA